MCSLCQNSNQQLTFSFFLADAKLNAENWKGFVFSVSNFQFSMFLSLVLCDAVAVFLCDYYLFILVVLSAALLLFNLLAHFFLFCFLFFFLFVLFLVLILPFYFSPEILSVYFLKTFLVFFQFNQWQCVHKLLYLYMFSYRGNISTGWNDNKCFSSCRNRFEKNGMTNIFFCSFALEIRRNNGFLPT